MKEKINQKGFAQIPLLTGVIIVAAIGVGFVLHKQGDLASITTEEPKMIEHGELLKESLKIGDTVEVYTGGSCLKIRRNAGTQTDDVLRCLPDGRMLGIISGPKNNIDGHNWWKVREEKYKSSPVEGWAAEKFLKPTISNSTFSLVQNYIAKLSGLFAGLAEGGISRTILNHPFGAYFLLISGLIFLMVILIKAQKEKGGKSRSSENYSAPRREYGDYRSSESDHEKESPEVNPLFKASKIKKDFLGDRVLKESSGGTVGKLTKGGFFDSGRTQTILNESGQKVGKITEGGFFDPKDTQIIRDKENKETGRIEVNFWGDRIIKDKSGEKVGEITKNFWGETVIKKNNK